MSRHDDDAFCCLLLLGISVIISLLVASSTTKDPQTKYNLEQTADGLMLLLDMVAMSQSDNVPETLVYANSASTTHSRMLDRQRTHNEAMLLEQQRLALALPSGREEQCPAVPAYYPPQLAQICVG